ncbi:glycosyltransferase family 4 protein [Fibrivirga algicola]|uniref:Glycosyltransferase family 4 protein n=1 Tax=Fibrivirga algicola TaxID=2950420 RepID=A0ABX0QIG2_9BACT|nr:glycosyltransferase family 4 protein [Fibrivirga algicola]NID10995.1 glycosyltransferase family 4 protein [Fibrivirga algicola]
MNIAVWHNLPSGGASRALHQHIRGLAERGHTITVYTTALADSAYLDVDQFAGAPKVVPLNMTVRIRHQYRDRVRSLALLPDTQIEWMLEACRQSAAQIMAGGHDVLFANSCQHFMMPYIGRFVNLPKALYLGEPNRSLFEAFPTQRWAALPPATDKWREAAYRTAFWRDIFEQRQARVRVREEIANYHSFDKVLLNSYFSNESVVKAYGGGGDVCYLGIDTGLFPHLNKARKPFVMGLGAFFPHKRPDTAIQTLAKLPASQRPSLVWVGNMGNEAYVADLKRLAANLGVDFQPRERVPQAELVDLLNTATCLLYTSELEPFGFAPLEANACGLPAVAVAEGGIRETVIDGKNGLLAPRDPEQLAAAVQRLLTNPDLQHRLSEQGRTWVAERWSIDAAIDRLENALMQVVAAKNH